MAVRARTPITENSAERIGYLAHVVECHHHHQRATVGSRQGRESSVAVDQALGAGSNIQHMPDRGVFTGLAALARPISG